MNVERLLHKRSRAQWVIRRVFLCDEGPVTRWWSDCGHERRPWQSPCTEHFGEPEDAAIFPTRLAAEEAHRERFGYTQGWTAQRVEDAFTEVRATYPRDAVGDARAG